MKITTILRSCHVQTVSKLFQPIATSPFQLDSNNKVTFRSQKLMLAAGIIHQAQNGLLHLLPLGMRALKKLTILVEDHMENDLGAQRITLSSLTSSDLWKLTGRMELAGVELFKLIDRHKKEFVLAPTHEESICNLLATVPLISHRNLPLLLYQISNKYRDEMRPRFGLIRSKEFLMKDLYSFDKNHDAAINTYGEVSKTYENILKRIGINYFKVAGNTGLMGGSYSHEYHYQAQIGDDTFIVCQNCDYAWNENLFDNGNKCKECGSSDLNQYKGIEVGHTFLLGTKYSSVLKAQFSADSQERKELFMGSYGLGMTRIIGAALEVLSTGDQLRWPARLAPYSAIIITPKDGSKEAVAANILLSDLCRVFQMIDQIKGDFLVDDRNHLTIGRRLSEAKLIGYPNIIVIGKSALHRPPVFEYFNMSEDLHIELTFESLIGRIKDSVNQNCINSKVADKSV